MVEPFVFEVTTSGTSAVGESPAIGVTVFAASTIVAANQTVAVDPDAWAGVLDVDGFTDPTTYSYQWYLGSGPSTPKPITGATASSYLIPVADIAKKLSVVVTAKSALWATGVSSRIPAGTIVAATALVDDASTVTIAAPTSLEPAGGAAWPTYNFGKWTTDNPTSIGFQWYECLLSTCTTSSPTSAFSAMKGQTDSTSYLPSTSSGELMFVRVTAAKPGFTSATVDSSVIQVAAAGVLVVGRPTISSVLSSAVPLRVGAMSYLQSSYVSNPYVSGIEDQYTAVAQTCSSDCTAVDADWEPVSGTIIPAITNEYPNTPPEYTPNAADWANGNGWVRIKETVDATTYPEVTVYSTPVKIGVGTFTPPYNQGATLVQTDGTDDTSKTFSVSAPDYLGTAPTIQWYEGTTALDGDSQVVENPTVAGVPEYAVVTWDIPGYNPITQVLAARHLTYPGPSTVANSIVGTTFGQTLEPAVLDPWGIYNTYPGAPGTLSYEWGSGYSTTPGFVPPASEVGHRQGLSIIYSNPLFTGNVQQNLIMASPLLGLEIDDSADAPSLSWTGDTLAPYSTVTVSHPDFSPAGVTTSYFWQISADGTTWETAGSTSDSISLPLYFSGLQLRAMVTGSEPGYVSDVEYSETEVIHAGDIVQDFTAPAITGDAIVGGTVTLDPGLWSSDTHVAIQWDLNGFAIPGANATTYQPLSNNVGGDLSVQETGTIPGQTTVTAKSNTLVIAEAASPTQLVESKITGKGTTASPLSVSTGSWSVGGLAYSYQWAYNGVAIDDATTSTLILPPDDTTLADVSVTITAQRSGYADATITVP